MIVLNEKQEEAVNHIVENIEKNPLLESPTGSGKTYILAESAFRLAKKGYKVIVSTPNNKLTVDGYELSLREKESELKVGLLIGASNYIDVNKYRDCKNSLVLEQYIEKESLLKWEEKFENHDAQLLFEDFDDIVNYKDIAHSSLVKSLITMDEPLKNNNFENFDITYTNHFYFLFRAAVSENLDLGSYVVLFDEVHELPAVAESVVQNRFSPFFLKNILYNCKEELNKNDDFTGKKTLLKEIENATIKTHQVLNATMSRSRDVGEYASKDEAVSFLNDLQLINQERTKTLMSKLNKTAKKNKLNGKTKQVFMAAYSELYELRSVLNAASASSFNVSVYFSPSRGYPTFLASTDSPINILRFKVWSRLKGGAGLSATLNTTKNVLDLSNKKFAYNRIGISPLNALEIKTFDRVFDKRLVKLFKEPIEPKTAFIESEDEKEKESVEEEFKTWAQEIAKYVKKTYDEKNSMIIVGSFKEAEAVGKELEKIIDSCSITVASKNLKTISCVKTFIKKGGILVGTRNFGTGISLNGELLERLYIAKLPFPQITSKKWQDLKEINVNLFWNIYINEMLMQARQYFGRLQRGPEDKGEIHLLDARGITGKNKRLSLLIDHFFYQYGVEAKDAKKIIKPSLVLNVEDGVDYF